MRPQPMIVVADVAAASAWFCAVLGLTSAHGGTEYEMLLDGDELVLQLHAWDVHDHPHLGDPDDRSRGNGTLLWFATDAFDDLVGRARAAEVTVIDGPLWNPNGRQHELWMRHPDGYTVVVAGPRNA